MWIVLYRKTTKYKIKGITSNSKSLEKDSIFVAIIGEKFNGLEFIPEAISKGACIVVAPLDYKNIIKEENVIFVKNTRDFLARSNFYFYNKYIPKNILTVSGTNGKSSVSCFISQFLNLLQTPNLLIGTLGIYIDGKKERDCLTTPDPSLLCEYFKIAKERNIEYVAMESSSHGIDQYRIDGLSFKAIGFTNLTQDHLDYHKSMENYFLAKARLYTDFQNTSVINVDDIYGQRLAEMCYAKGIKVIEYGRNAKKEAMNLKILRVCKENISHNVSIVTGDYEFNIKINLMGEFQVYNIICALGMLVACGFSINSLLPLVDNIKEVDGRLNLIRSKNRMIIGRIFLDFAHTPNALEEVLKILKQENPKKLKVLFGCGGNRDKTKRPIMGKIASKYADVVYITDDNPRFEDPDKIRSEIAQGIINNTCCFNIEDRAKAINQAVKELKEDEILLLAGKGHETYQIIGDQEIYFSDKEVILKALEQI